MADSGVLKLFEEAVQAAHEAGLEPPTGCKFYKEPGFCRVTGGPCPHFESTYTRCVVRSETPDNYPLALPFEKSDE